MPGSPTGLSEVYRIFNVEDNYFFHDMAKVEEMIKMLDEKVYTTKKPMPEKVTPTKLVKIGGKWVRADEPEIMTNPEVVFVLLPWAL